MKIVIIFLFVSTGVAAEISMESCPNILGFLKWKRGTSTSFEDLESQKTEASREATDREAERNRKNLKLKTCCDFKNKCSFRANMNTRNGQTTSCSFSYSCPALQGDILLLRRNESGGGSSAPYCSSVGEKSSNVNDCQLTESCLKHSPDYTELLLCLNAAFAGAETKGFFSSSIYPYSKFEFVNNIDYTTNITYEIDSTGNVVKTEKPI